MIFVRTFKGYEDRTAELDAATNAWIREHSVNVVSVQTTMSHEYEGRAKSGDLVYTVIYKADAPIEG